MMVKDVVELSVKDAVAIRFKELCDQQNIRPNELAVRSGVTPSTVYSMLDSSRHSVSIGTIYLNSSQRKQEQFTRFAAWCW